MRQLVFLTHEDGFYLKVPLRVWMHFIFAYCDGTCYNFGHRSQLFVFFLVLICTLTMIVSNSVNQFTKLSLVLRLKTGPEVRLVSFYI